MVGQRWKRTRDTPEVEAPESSDVKLQDAWPPVRTPVVVVFPKSDAEPLETTVADHGGPSPILVLVAPHSGGDLMVAGSGETLMVKWYSPKGVHLLTGTFDTSTAEREPLWHVQVEGEPTVTNRRRYPRVQKHETLLVGLGAHGIAVRLKDISQGGMRCQFREDIAVFATGQGAAPPRRGKAPLDEIETTSQVALDLNLGLEGAIAIQGSVAWVNKALKPMEFGIEFEELHGGDPRAGALRRHLYMLQRAQRPDGEGTSGA